MSLSCATKHTIRKFISANKYFEFIAIQIVHNNKNTSLYASHFSDAKFLRKVFYM